MTKLQTGIFLLAIASLATPASATGPGIATTTTYAVALQPDGKIVAAGDLLYQGESFVAVTRYDTNGKPDPTFGNDGRVETHVPALYSNSYAIGVAVGPDGKIVAAGGGRDTLDIVVTRYNPDGTPDAAFGTGGVVETNLGTPGVEDAREVAIQSDGKVVVIVRASGTLFLLRYTDSGALDPSFDSDGIVAFSETLRDIYDLHVLLQPDGRILVSAATNGTDNVMIRRFLSDGQPDPTFSGDGVTTISTPAVGQWIALQEDGKIVLAMSDGVLVRFTADGALDTTFDSDGVVYPPALQQLAGVVVLGDGKIVVSGTGRMARYLDNGSLDPTFGAGGIVNQEPETYIDAMIAQPDGKILTAGAQLAWLTGWTAYTKRFDTDGTPDFGFADDGVALETLCEHVPPTSPTCIDASSTSVRICNYRSISQWSWHGLDVANVAAASGAASSYELCVTDTHGSLPDSVSHRPIATSSWTPALNGWTFKRHYWPQQVVRVRTPPSPRFPNANYKLMSRAADPFSATRYFEATGDVTVQLVNSDGLCFRSVFTSDDVTRNDGECFQASK